MRVKNQMAEGEKVGRRQGGGFNVLFHELRIAIGK